MSSCSESIMKNKFDQIYLNIINDKKIITEENSFNNVYEEFMEAADSFVFEIVNSTNQIKKTDILNDFIKYTKEYYTSPIFNKDFINTELYNMLKEADVNILE